MINVEIQYFEGCPNSGELLERTKEAIAKCDLDVNLIEVLVDSPAKAIDIKFRGSPTLLINGEDFEGMPEPDNPSLACRYYKDGLPSVESIREKILIA